MALDEQSEPHREASCGDVPPVCALPILLTAADCQLIRTAMRVDRKTVQDAQVTHALSGRSCCWAAGWAFSSSAKRTSSPENIRQSLARSDPLRAAMPACAAFLGAKDGCELGRFFASPHLRCLHKENGPWQSLQAVCSICGGHLASGTFSMKPPKENATRILADTYSVDAGKLGGVRYSRRRAGERDLDQASSLPSLRSSLVFACGSD